MRGVQRLTPSVWSSAVMSQKDRAGGADGDPQRGMRAAFGHQRPTC
jgi:hypothetical protein